MEQEVFLWGDRLEDVRTQNASQLVHEAFQMCLHKFRLPQSNFTQYPNAIITYL